MSWFLALHSTRSVWLLYNNVLHGQEFTVSSDEENLMVLLETNLKMAPKTDRSGAGIDSQLTI